eukprot:14912446-Heterocapsa_arctica.AAC.1
MDLFTDRDHSDLAFLMNGFGSNPELVTLLAELMRDGVLEKTLRDKLFGDDQKITEPWRQLFLVQQLGLSHGAFLPFANQKQSCPCCAEGQLRGKIMAR